MKFQCDQCHTRYSIADEKVRGKILKIRCKTCEAVITIRDGDDTAARLLASPAPAISAAGGKGRNVKPARSTIELQSVTGSMAVPMPQPSSPPPSPPSMGRAPVEPVSGPSEEWYLSVDGTQDGPLSAEEAQRRVSRKAPGVEMFAWRDDFADWLPVEEVPVLAVHLQRRVPPPPPRRMSGPLGVGTGSSTSLPGPRPTAAGGLRISSPAVAVPRAAAPAAGTPEPTPTPAPMESRADMTEIDDPFDVAGRARDRDEEGESDDDAAETPPAADFDFHIGEASRVVKLPILPPSLVAAAKSLGNDSALPGVSTPAAPEASESLKLPITEASRVMPSMPLAPVRKKRGLGVPLAVAGCAVAGLLAAVVLLTRGSDDKTQGTVADKPTDDVVITDFYKNKPTLAEVRSPEAAQTPVIAPALPSKSAPPPKIPVPKARVADPPHITAAVAPVSARPGGKQDTFDDEASSSDPLTPDDVRNTYAANEVGLKRCYERALKADPETSVAKMVVKISISPHGAVTDIAVPDKGDLATCVQSSIRSWRFRRSNGEFTTEFTVFFAKRG